MWISRAHYDSLLAEIARLQKRELELLNVILPHDGFRTIEQGGVKKTDTLAIPRRKETPQQFARRKAKAIAEQAHALILDRRIFVGTSHGIQELGDRDNLTKPAANGEPAAKSTEAARP